MPAYQKIYGKVAAATCIRVAEPEGAQRSALMLIGFGGTSDLYPRPEMRHQPNGIEGAGVRIAVDDEQLLAKCGVLIGPLFGSHLHNATHCLAVLGE